MRRELIEKMATLIRGRNALAGRSSRDIANDILSLLSDPANITDEALISFNASVEQSLPYVRMKYDADTLRRALAAAIASWSRARAFAGNGHRPRRTGRNRSSSPI